MASKGVNQVTLLGNLGADPEVKHTPSGGSVATMSIATSEEWKDKETGQDKSVTDWHRVVIFGKLAEIAGQYLKKGSKVFVQGKLKTRKWEDNNGIERYTTEIVLSGFDSKMQMLDSTTTGGTPHPANAVENKQQSNVVSMNQQYTENNPPPVDVDMDDDIPF